MPAGGNASVIAPKLIWLTLELAANFVGAKVTSHRIFAVVLAITTPLFINATTIGALELSGSTGQLGDVIAIEFITTIGTIIITITTPHWHYTGCRVGTMLVGHISSRAIGHGAMLLITEILAIADLITHELLGDTLTAAATESIRFTFTNELRFIGTIATLMYAIAGFFLRYASVIVAHEVIAGANSYNAITTRFIGLIQAMRYTVTGQV